MGYWTNSFWPSFDCPRLFNFLIGLHPKNYWRLVGVSSLGYIIDSCANFILPNYADYEAIFLMIVALPAIIGKFSLTFWLLVKGANIEQWEKRACESAV